MDMYLSVEIMKLKNEMSETLNKSPLPICVKQMVVAECGSVLNQLAIQEHENDLLALQEDKSKGGKSVQKNSVSDQKGQSK